MFFDDVTLRDPNQEVTPGRTLTLGPGALTLTLGLTLTLTLTLDPD